MLLCARHNIAHVLLLRDGAGTFRLPGGKLKPGETELDGLRRKLVSGVCALARGGGGGGCVRPLTRAEPLSPTGVMVRRATRASGQALRWRCVVSDVLTMPPSARIATRPVITPATRMPQASKLNPPPESPIAGPAWSVNGSTKLGTWWRPNFESPLFPFKPAHVTEPKESRSVYLVSMPEEAFLAPATNFKLVAVPLHELYDNAGRYGPVLAAVPTMLASVQLNIVSTGKAEGE